MNKAQKAFSLFAVFGAILVLSLIIFSGIYVYSSNKSDIDTEKESNQSQSPEEVVNELTKALIADDEEKIKSYLSPEYNRFRENDLINSKSGACTAKKPGKGLYCGSLLGISPVYCSAEGIKEFKFKDGKNGISLDCVTNIYKTDSGGTVTYHSFKFIPSNNSWLVHDYYDVESIDSKPDMQLGQRERREKFLESKAP